jgi:hypothetical protein
MSGGKRSSPAMHDFGLVEILLAAAVLIAVAVPAVNPGSVGVGRSGSEGQPKTGGAEAVAVTDFKLPFLTRTGRS